MKKTVEDFKLETIDNLMKDINGKMPFYNEKQFQFELASAIRAKGYNVLFEMYYTNDLKEDEENSEVKKSYTDIVVYDDSKNFIPIELKYGLADNNIKERWKYKTKNGDFISIAKKGASNLVRYSFLKDVNRLENIAKCQGTSYEDGRLKKFCKGFAILLANDKLLWERKQRECKKKKYQYQCFCIGENDKVNGILKMEGKNSVVIGGKYKCKWSGDPYFASDEAENGPPFKYLVFEINNKNKDKK